MLPGDISLCDTEPWDNVPPACPDSQLQSNGSLQDNGQSCGNTHSRNIDQSHDNASLERFASCMVAYEHAFPSSNLAANNMADFRILAKDEAQAAQDLATITTFPYGDKAARLDFDILGVTQSARAIGCDISASTFTVRLLFSDFDDTVTAHNSKPGQNNTLVFRSAKDSHVSLWLNPGKPQVLQPGIWFIESPKAEPWQRWMQLYIKPLKPWLITAATTQVTGVKRIQEEVEDSGKHKKTADGRHIQTSKPAWNAILQLALDGGAMALTGPDRNDRYTISHHKTHHKVVRSTKSSCIYTADFSLRPGQIVIVKSFVPSADYVSLAERWHQEVRAYGQMGQHVSHTNHTYERLTSNYELIQPCIPRLFGSDARLRTLYIEYIDSQSLEAYQTSGMCTCSEKAYVILSDIASALQFVHATSLVHNDIRPCNILYHINRGAVLCGFGHAQSKESAYFRGGTPWYLPPEFLTRKKDRRGPPADIFALGVTMLWAIQKCSLPEKPGPGHIPEWQIADVQGLDSGKGAVAEIAMARWMQKLGELKSDLSQDASSMECVVRCMLADRQDRPTAEDVISRLKLLSLE